MEMMFYKTNNINAEMKSILTKIKSKHKELKWKWEKDGMGYPSLYCKYKGSELTVFVHNQRADIIYYQLFIPEINYEINGLTDIFLIDKNISDIKSLVKQITRK